jgi:transposase-like protein/IS1 family transposase
MKCHCCDGEEFKRNGSFSNRNRMVQRYQCLRCGKTFSETQPLDGVRIDADKAAMVVNLLCEGVGIRAISRLTMLNKNTVLNVLETAGRHCEELLNVRLVNLRVADVEIDEIYGFVRTLEFNTTPNNLVAGDQYCFLAVEKNSKLILHWEIGKRDTDTSAAFLRGLKSRLDGGKFQMTSDGFRPYWGSHEGGVKSTFGPEVDYGIEMKYYSKPANFGPFKPRRETPVVLQGIKREPKLGNPDPAKMTVNHIERQNLNIRLFNRRFTRKTLGYSKCLRNHRLAVALQIAHWNFVRVHSAHKMTPAQAAGLTDHAWTVEELLAAN